MTRQEWKYLPAVFVGLGLNIKVPELEAKAKDEGMNPTKLWSWLYEIRRKEGRA